jgi:hypothetical protein
MYFTRDALDLTFVCTHHYDEEEWNAKCEVKANRGSIEPPKTEAQTQPGKKKTKTEEKSNREDASNPGHWW